MSLTDVAIEWAAAEPTPASRIEMHMVSEASSEDGAVLERTDLHPFRVLCGGHELFVGVFYFIYGTAALHTPVPHVERDTDDRIIPRVGAWEGGRLIPTEGDAEARERIDRPELRTFFCQRGALQELDATSE